MRRFLFVGLSFFLAALNAGCSSTNDKTEETTVDSGKPKDSGPKDTAVEEDDGPATDTGTAPSDTGSKPDTTSDTGSGGGCDKHTGDECDLVLQNCADPTASCRYDGSVKHNVCDKIPTGTKLKGEACVVQTDCDRGLECVNGRCSPPCCAGDNSTCGADGACDLAMTDESEKVVYHLCSYSKKCNPFKFDCPSGEVCLFDSLPDQFRCSVPSGGTPLNQAPGRECNYRNDCGESQGCSTITSGGADAGPAKAMCYVYCYLSKPAGWTPGTMPDGRFAANGTCTVGGVNYGTCRDFSVSGLGGGLGICVK